VLIEHNRKNTDKTPVDFIIKWNPRREKKESWLDYAEQHGRRASTREGKREALFSVEHKREGRVLSIQFGGSCVLLSEAWIKKASYY
jgi:hypothetical protein